MRTYQTGDAELDQMIQQLVDAALSGHDRQEHEPDSDLVREMVVSGIKLLPSQIRYFT